MPFKQMQVQEQRVEFAVRARLGAESLSQLCREFGISRPTGYKWLTRLSHHGVEGIAERSRRPLCSPTQTAPELEARIVALRGVYPDWGARKLAVLLDGRALLCRRARFIAFCCATGWCATRTGIHQPPSALSAPGPTSCGRWISRGPSIGPSR